MASMDAPVAVTAVSFQVRVRLADKQETVCITGDSGALGLWEFRDAVPLSLVDADEGLWTVELNLPTNKPVSYAYIVRRGRNFRRREGFASHRQMTPYGARMVVDDSDFGVVGTGDARTARVDLGWLCDEVQLRVTLGGRASLDGVVVPGVRLHDNACTYVADFRMASENATGVDDELWTGFNHRGLDTFVFSAPSREDLSFFVNLEVTVPSSSDAAGPASAANDTLASSNGRTFPVRVYVNHSELEYKGELIRTILDSHYRPIGELTLQYLVITPLRHPSNTLNNSCGDFRLEQSPLVVGHRGSGATNDPKVLHTLTENTLISFMGACRDGADYVEFDVQLTKDGVPIIVHDEEITIKTLGSDGQELRQKVPVNKVLFDKFRQMEPVMPRKVHEVRQLQESGSQRAGDKPLHEQPLAQSIIGHVSPRIRTKTAMLRRSSVDNWQARLGNYPSLEELFDYLPPELGFNVEIKYPFSLAYERFLGIMERNAYVDRILTVMLEKAGDRKCYISSFDPDVCLMCSQKQAKFPVFLLTTGGRVFFRNPVKNSLEAAVSFARKERLCGVVSDVSAVMADAHLVGEAHDAGLLVFTYGSQNKDTELVRRQMQAGVDGIITDTVLGILPTCRNSAEVERKAIESLASGAFAISGGTSPAPKKPYTEDDLLRLITSEEVKH